MKQLQKIVLKPLILESLHTPSVLQFPLSAQSIFELSCTDRQTDQLSIKPEERIQIAGFTVFLWGILEPLN